MALLTVLIFGGTAALYTFTAIAHVLYMFRSDYDRVARWSTRAAFLLHTLGLAVVVIQTQRLPVFTLFEFSYFFTWVLMGNYVAIEYMRKSQTAGAFLTPVVAAVLILSAGLPKPGAAEQMFQEFPASLIAWHVVVILLGYLLFVMSFVFGALYLIQERNLKRKKWGPLYYRLPSLETLDLWSGRYVLLGFPLLTIGVGAGAVFAHLTWTTFWQGDPKVIFTFLVWLIYGGYLLMRTVVGWGGRKAAWWSVAGVAGLLINYFVMNLLSKLHRFV